MSTSTLDRPSATLLSKQGIAALQSGNMMQARELLSQALQLDPTDDHAWLWLSGAVVSDAERRYCLERVMAINPAHPHAQRGLEQLAAVRESRSPLPEPPAADVVSPGPASHDTLPGYMVSSPAPVQSVAPAAAPPSGDSLLGILMQPDDAPAPTSSVGGAQLGLLAASFVVAPAALSMAAPAPSPAPTHATTTSTEDPARQAAIDYIIKSYASHRSRDEIIRGLSMDLGVAWDDARNLVFEVERKHRRKIAARQSPFYIFLGVCTLLGGMFLAGRAGFSLYYWYDRVNSGVVVIPDPRAIVFLLVQLVTGIAMVLGSTIGMGQTIKSLFK